MNLHALCKNLICSLLVWLALVECIQVLLGFFFPLFCTVRDRIVNRNGEEHIDLLVSFPKN